MPLLWGKFNLIRLPKGSALDAIDFFPLFFCRCSQRSIQLEFSYMCKMTQQLYCLISKAWSESRGEMQERFNFFCFGTHTHAAFPFCAEEEINLPTEGNCAHANCFEKPSLTLYGAISSDSRFGNRQTLTLILELWHCGVQKSCSFQFSGLVFRVSSAATAAVSVVEGGGWAVFFAHIAEMKKSSYGNPSQGRLQGLPSPSKTLKRL